MECVSCEIYTINTNMNIKVSGITQFKQLKQLDALDIEFAGLNFCKNSKRFIGNTLTADEIREADFDIKKTGVFVNQEYDEIMEISGNFELDVIQLHGEETAQLCKKLSRENELIKTFHINENFAKNLDEILKPYDETCDYYLFHYTDEKREINSSGKKFDWSILLKYKIEKPFFIAGGISLEDAPILKKFDHPDFFGIDINSAFETATGVKDLMKVLLFKKMLH